MLKVKFCFKFEVRMSKLLSSVQMNQGPFRLEMAQLFSTVHLLTDGSDHVSIVYKTLQSAPTLTPAPSYRSPLPCRPSPPRPPLLPWATTGVAHGCGINCGI
jgi:hypothetical protein